MVREPRDLTAEFGQRYEFVTHPALRRAEQLVIGADYGATSYTTVAQADQLAAILRLGSGSQLLDVGAGAGWPGLHLAASTGCRVVLADLPLEGLHVARRRAAAEGIDSRAVAATGAELPFADATFDAVTSSDVLC